MTIERIQYYNEGVAQNIDSEAGLTPKDYLKDPDVVGKPANIISSLAKDGLHYPVLDIDFPIYVVPSTAHGHFHLYIDKGLEWNTFKHILNAMEGNLLQEGYVKASIERGQTCVRLPWVKKAN